MKVYVFKLNINPVVLDQYLGDFQQLIQSVVSDDFDKIFERKESNDSLIKYNLKDERQIIIESDEYKHLIEQNSQSKELYRQVEERYNNSGDIMYSRVYMENRKSFSDLIDKIEYKFPVLKASEKVKLRDVFGTSTNEIGMNKKYIQKADKIEHYVEISLDKQNVDKSIFFYNFIDEHIYIPAQALKEAKDFAESINNIINSNSEQLNIGEVSINVLYEENGKIEVKSGNYSVLKILEVFPNGSAIKRAEALNKDPIELLKAAKAKKEYIAPNNQVLDLDAYVDNKGVQESLHKGYQDITYRNKSIITTAPRVIEIEDFTDD